jgi:glycosyltransferase involved in cell wall biosynthesis
MLFPTGSPAGLADAVLRILGDPDLRQRLRREGPRRVRERFTSARYARDVEALYAGLA